ncbi:MAG TPA: hypothetical protein VL354_13880, partial [Spirochaetia bacterium]|nr:hypothetical protein [Spirochaetia bacterium]
SGGFDLIITDLMMPPDEGDVLQAIARERCRAEPVIDITSFGDEPEFLGLTSQCGFIHQLRVRGEAGSFRDHSLRRHEKSQPLFPEQRTHRRCDEFSMAILHPHRQDIPSQ